MDGHEWTGLALAYIDDYFLKFIKDLEKNKILDDTFVILLSDHG